MQARLLTPANRKGDYHRYLAEFASGEKRKTAATAAHEAYKVCPKIIRAHLESDLTQDRTLPTLLRPS